MSRYWTCSRVTNGIRCGAKNPARRRKCMLCNKPRPARKRPAHLKALDLPYEAYVQLQGGEFCGICGARPKPGRRLHREHAHVGDGVPRGLACWPCNRKLGNLDEAWLEAALSYLRRANRQPKGEAA